MSVLPGDPSNRAEQSTLYCPALHLLVAPLLSIDEYLKISCICTVAVLIPSNTLQIGELVTVLH